VEDASRCGPRGGPADRKAPRPAGGDGGDGIAWPDPCGYPPDRLSEEAAVFVEEYLQELRAARFRPRALGRYARRLAAHVREDLVNQPSAVRSVWSVALAFIVAAFLGAAALALGHDRRLAYDFFVESVIGILIMFTLVTLSIGLLRDRQGYRLSSINVPTVLTLLRVALLPGIMLMLIERRFDVALWMYVTAAVTDVFDGWVARRWNQVTRLGTVLDPIVDIVFNLSLAGGLMAAGLVPAWVFGLAALRYALLLVGGAALYVFVGPVRIAPTHLGRLSGVVMTMLVGLLILLQHRNGDLAGRLAPLTEIALGVLFALTVAQAIGMGWYNLKVMRGQAQARGRVVGDVRWDAS
jgi:cardiolipin synthase